MKPLRCTSEKPSCRKNLASHRRALIHAFAMSSDSRCHRTLSSACCPRFGKSAFQVLALWWSACRNWSWHILHERLLHSMHVWLVFSIPGNDLRTRVAYGFCAFAMDNQNCNLPCNWSGNSTAQVSVVVQRSYSLTSESNGMNHDELLCPTVNSYFFHLH